VRDPGERPLERIRREDARGSVDQRFERVVAAVER
jgi:hypothetical protein